MNEAILYRKALFQKNGIHVGDLLCSPSKSKNNSNKDILKDNKKTIFSNINNEPRNAFKKMRKFKTQDKNIVLDKSLDYFPPNLKKRNCNLKFNYNRNKNKINVIGNILKRLEEKTQNEFEGFKIEADKIFNSIYYNKDT